MAFNEVLSDIFRLYGCPAFTAGDAQMQRTKDEIQRRRAAPANSLPFIQPELLGFERAFYHCALCRQP